MVSPRLASTNRWAERSARANSAGCCCAFSRAIIRPISTGEREATLRGRRTQVFAYEVKPEFARHRLTFGDVRGVQSIFVSDHGLLYVDAESKQVMKVVSVADHIPVTFPIRRSDTTVDCDFADVGGKTYLLPLHAEAIAESVRETTRNDVQFDRYRKFSVDERIRYQSPAELTEDRLREKKR